MTPADIEAISGYLFGVYADIEIDLLANVAGMFRFEDIPATDEAAAWYFRMLEEAGALRSKNVRLLARYAKRTEAEIRGIVQRAGFTTLEHDERLYERAFKAGAVLTQPAAIAMSPRISQILNTAARNMKQQFNLVNTTCLESANGAFMQILNKSLLDASTGIKSLQDATRDAVQRMAKEGITGVKYQKPNGGIIRYNTDTAVRRAVLTTTSQMTGELQLQRAREWGCNLVEVSSHGAARPTHAVWQGKIYSIEGGTPQYPNLVETTDYGSVTGLKGANCSHEFYPFFEGISEQKYEPTPNKAQNAADYENTQTLRGMERSMRELKRREAAAAAMNDDKSLEAMRARIKIKDAEIRQFTKQTDVPRRKDRETVA